MMDTFGPIGIFKVMPWRHKLFVLVLILLMPILFAVTIGQKTTLTSGVAANVPTASCPGLPFKVGDELVVSATLAKEFGEGQATNPAFRTGEKVHVLAVSPDCQYINVNGTRYPYQEIIKVHVGWWTGSFP